MILTWVIDRGAGLVALAALWFAMLTGVAYNVRRLGALHESARATHVPASAIASVALLLHVSLGAFDTWEVLRGAVAPPAYSNAYLVMGALVGLAALVITVVSILAFVDPKRFQRPWDPRVVHAFAYAGFVFAIVHTVALGTDITSALVPPLAAATLVLLVALVVRFASERAALPDAKEASAR